jgi:hypothetical protein
VFVVPDKCIWLTSFFHIDPAYTPLPSIRRYSGKRFDRLEIALVRFFGYLSEHPRFILGSIRLPKPEEERDGKGRQYHAACGRCLEWPSWGCCGRAQQGSQSSR